MIFLTPIVKLFGAKDAYVLSYAKYYVSVILIGTPFNVLAMSISNLVRVDGHPRLSMYGMMIGAAPHTKGVFFRDFHRDYPGRLSRYAAGNQ